MVQEKDLKTRYSDYDGGKNMRPALEFILQMFKSKMPPGKPLTHDFVSARVKSDIRGAFNTVKKTLYEDHRDVLIAKVLGIKKRQKEVQSEKEGAKKGCC